MDRDANISHFRLEVSYTYPRNKLDDLYLVPHRAGDVEKHNYDTLTKGYKI